MHLTPPHQTLTLTSALARFHALVLPKAPGEERTDVWSGLRGDPILPTICEENPPALARPPAFLRALLCKAQDSSCNKSPTQTTANHRQTRLPSDHRSKHPHRSQSHGLVLQQNSEGCCTSPRRMLTLHTPQFSRRYRGPPPPNRSPFAALRA